jgi:6-pyruvoyltetrahydropterin/6-carboxytetrahydropterin synthase
VEVQVRAKDLDGAGMAIDFHELKAMTGAILEELDHRLLNELPAFQHQSPTAENLARHVYERLADRLPQERVKLECVRVWESDTTAAAYLAPCSP